MTEAMHALYDFRTMPSRPCATFVVAARACEWQSAHVLSQDDIIRELAERGITHKAIAAVLGVATSNATKLFNPAGKTGKPRKLSYDEGVALINEFGLDAAGDDVAIAPMSVPVARLAVQYVAQQLGVKIDPDDERVEDLAQDIRAYSEFAASSQTGDNLDRAEGWLDGRRSRTLTRS